MNYFDNVRDKLKQTLANKFIRNLGWLSGAELINRVIRLATTIVLARFFTSYDYGLVAIVVATYEFMEVFTKIGISAKLIQADENDFEALCNGAYWLSWVIFIGIALIQCLASFPIAWFYQDMNLVSPICVFAIAYLIVPISTIQYSLLLRENRLSIRALATLATTSSSNILSLILAASGMGVWAIVFSRVLTAPIWTYIHYTNHPWRPTGGFTTHRWPEIFQFGKNLLGVELLNTLRNNLDYLLVGRFLGLEELGFYYFAFNAGLGISLSLTTAIRTALLPHFCSARISLQALKQQFFKSLRIISLMIVPLVLLQTSLAPLYVPLVFGQKWIPAIPVLMLICLSAIPRPLGDAASQLLIAIGQPNLDFKWNIIFTVIFTLGLWIGVQWQSIGVAISVLAVHAIALPTFAIWATRYTFRTQPAESFQ